LRGKDLAFISKSGQVGGGVDFSVAFGGDGGIFLDDYLVCHIEIGPKGGSLRIVTVVEGNRRDSNIVEEVVEWQELG